MTPSDRFRTEAYKLFVIANHNKATPSRFWGVLDKLQAKIEALSEEQQSEFIEYLLKLDIWVKSEYFEMLTVDEIFEQLETKADDFLY